MAMLVCPVCGSTKMKEVAPGNFKCLSCRNVFQDQGASRGSAGGNVGTQSTNKSGAEIYDIGIKGTVILTCNDFGTTGSGFIVDHKNCLIITNCHVVSDHDGNACTKDLWVTINGEDIRAGVVARGDVEKLDIALVECEYLPAGTSALHVFDSDKVKRGEGCYAIGNSKGDGLCIKKGIVSDLNRQVGYQKLMMCDVATNPGNSGGPLLNEHGQVIAICVSGRTDAVGMNYFIPTRTLAESLKEYVRIDLE